jgi:hypothetical protein
MNTTRQPTPHRVRTGGFQPPACLSHLWMACLLFLGFLPGPSHGQVSGAMDIWPRNSSVELGSTRQFGAYVPIVPNTITWLVNDIPGGNTTVGTINSAGLYTPPATAPSANVVTVKARSTAYPGSFASTPLAITRKYPWLWSLSPSSLNMGNYQVSLNGANFAPDSKVLANGVEIPTSFVSSTRLVANGVASQTGTLQFRVAQPAPGAVTGNVVSATVTLAAPPPVSVVVSPTTASVQLGASRSFQVSVTGSVNTTVTWSVNGIAGGSAAVGTVSAAGVYTAPSVMPASSNVTVRATSAANTLAFAQASVTLSAPPPPPVTPPSPGLLAAGRFLEQSSFGPTPATLVQVQQLGVTAYLDAQLSLSETPIPTPSGNSLGHFGSGRFTTTRLRPISCVSGWPTH